MADNSKGAAPHQAAASNAKQIPGINEQVAALEGASMCDALHRAGQPGCRDCARHLRRQSALLLLAVLGPQESIVTLLNEAKRFRRSNPMAWPSIEHSNAMGLVRALKMTAPEKRTADDIRHAVELLGAQVKAA